MNHRAALLDSIVALDAGPLDAAHVEELTDTAMRRLDDVGMTRAAESIRAARHDLLRGTDCTPRETARRALRDVLCGALDATMAGPEPNEDPAVMVDAELDTGDYAN